MTKLTKINGNEIKIFKREYLEELFTEKVKEFLMQGYRFYCNNGTHGEEMKASLTKDGKTVYVIFINKENYNLNNWWKYTNELTLKINKYENVTRGDTLWLNKGETVFVCDLYQIGNDRDEVYVGNVEDFNFWYNFHWGRRENRAMWDNMILSDNFKSIALKIVKKRKGHKSAKLSDIKSVEKEKNRFVIILNNNQRIWVE
jgi:hypothetical protein